MLGNEEIRNLKEGTLFNVAQILDTNDDWKRFMSLIPKDLNSENSTPKYNNEHIRLIENYSRTTRKNCAEILFDEWGTSGRVRPTIDTIKKIAMQAGMLRVADEIAKILGEAPPPRPQTGPGAPVDINFSCVLNESSSELTTGEKSRNNQTTAQMQSENNDSSNKKLQAQPTVEMMSESDMIKFSQNIESIIASTRQMQAENRNESNNTFQGRTTREMKSASDLIKFSKASTDMQSPTPSEDWEPNIPAWSQIVIGPHTLNTKPYGKSEQLGSSDLTVTMPSDNALKADSTVNTDYQQSLPNIEVFQNNTQTHAPDQNLSFSSVIDKSILEDTKLIHFNYKELQAITNDFSDTLLNGPYGLCGKIGFGGYGEVYVGSHPDHGPLAVKRTHQNIVKMYKPEVAVKAFNSEVKHLAQFRHKNIVPIIGFSKDGPALCIVCDYVDGGSLESKIAERVLNETQRINIMLGTAEGLQYLHNYELNKKLSFSTSSSDSSGQNVSKTNFVHRDVKSSNILLTKDFIPKLCDFGLAKQYDTTFITSAPLGTQAYMAPEGLYGTITQKIDIYSYGLVLLELLTGLKIIVKMENGDTFQIKQYIDEGIKRGGKNVTDFLDPSAGGWTKADEVYKLAQQCLETDRHDRPAAEEICETLHILNEK